MCVYSGCSGVVMMTSYDCSMCCNMCVMCVYYDCNVFIIYVTCVGDMFVIQV